MASKKILIVDDDPSTLVLVSELVEKAGFGAVGFRKSAQALEYLDRSDLNDIRMVIADLTQGNTDGFNFLKDLKKKANVKDLPFLFLSAMHDTTMLINAFEHGAVDYFNKPIKKELFIAKIRSMSGAFEAHLMKAHTLLTGRLSEKPLDEIVAYCERESLNGFLTVTQPDHGVGILTFIKGLPDKIEIRDKNKRLLFSETEAFEQMHEWKNGDFTVRRGNVEEL